jgi:hypothetical protein
MMLHSSISKIYIPFPTCKNEFKGNLPHPTPQSVTKYDQLKQASLQYAEKNALILSYRLGMDIRLASTNMCMLWIKIPA